MNSSVSFNDITDRIDLAKKIYDEYNVYRNVNHKEVHEKAIELAQAVDKAVCEFVTRGNIGVEEPKNPFVAPKLSYETVKEVADKVKTYFVRY